MRRRGRDSGANPVVRPLIKVELDETHHKKRWIWVVGLLVIGLSFLGYAIFSALTKDPGWGQIKPVTATSDSVAGDMILYYELGATDRSPTAEHKELSRLYTEACIEAYRMFSVQQAFDGVQNLYQVNLHLNSPVTVEPALYRAFELMERTGSRILFAAPFYREYGNLFASSDDGYAEQYDPRKSEEVADYFAALSTFTASAEHIRLELLGENTVKLVVSDAYRAFAGENGIEIFVDLHWTRNAFAVDWIAERLMEQGFTHGTLSSYDGFIRSLDERAVEYANPLYGMVIREDGQYADIATLRYVGRQSTVYLRAHRLYEYDNMYYTYKDGERRHPYVDVNDGLCKSATDGMIAYAGDKSCAEILFAMIPVYLSDSLSDSGLADMKHAGISSVYVEGTTVHHNDPEAKLTNVYPGITVVLDN